MTSSDLATAAFAKSRLDGEFHDLLTETISVLDRAKGYAADFEARHMSNVALQVCIDADAVLHRLRGLLAATASPATGSDRGRDEPIPTDRTSTRESEK